MLGNGLAVSEAVLTGSYMLLVSVANQQLYYNILNQPKFLKDLQRQPHTEHMIVIQEGCNKSTYHCSQIRHNFVSSYFAIKVYSHVVPLVTLKEIPRS